MADTGQLTFAAVDRHSASYAITVIWTDGTVSRYEAYSVPLSDLPALLEHLAREIEEKIAEGNE